MEVARYPHPVGDALLIRPKIGGRPNGSLPLPVPHWAPGAAGSVLSDARRSGVLPYPCSHNPAAGSAPSALDPLPSIALPGSRVTLLIQVKNAATPRHETHEQPERKREPKSKKKRNSSRHDQENQTRSSLDI
jgi:hypothetical protein